jgi:CRISPR-associated protein Csx3
MSERTYKISAETMPSGVLLRLSFGTPAQNDQIVKDAVATLGELNLQGGETVYLNGPASLPVACAIAHGVAHLFQEVAVFDPKIAGYVMAISHGGREVGTIIRL